jgi:hypothetical protein
MGDLADIRPALATALAPIAGLRSTLRSDQLNTPCVEIGWPTRIDFDEDSDDDATYTIPVRAWIGLAENRASADLLQGYMAKTGSKSIRAALETDTTLGGKCESLRVTAMTGSGADEAEVGGPTYLVADWEVQIFA